jgi:predicted ester cyclase
MVGCQDKEAMAELEAMKAQTEVEEQNKEIVRNWLKLIDEGNLNGAMELFAPNLRWYSPSNNPAPMSKEESHEFLVMVLKAFPKWQHKIEEIMAVGDKVITRAIDITTHEGEFQGIPATGNKVEFGVLVIWTLEDGKIVEMREDGDTLGFFQQLGMELKPKEGE